MNTLLGLLRSHFQLIFAMKVFHYPSVVVKFDLLVLISCGSRSIKIGFEGLPFQI